MVGVFFFHTLKLYLFFSSDREADPNWKTILWPKMEFWKAHKAKRVQLCSTFIIFESIKIGNHTDSRTFYLKLFWEILDKCIKISWKRGCLRETINITSATEPPRALPYRLYKGLRKQSKTSYFYTRENIKTDFLFGVFPGNYFIKTNLNLSVFCPWRW